MIINCPNYVHQFIPKGTIFRPVCANKPSNIQPFQELYQIVRFNIFVYDGISYLAEIVEKGQKS